jgi:hypothetical protein
MKKYIILLVLFAVMVFQPCTGQENYVEKGLKAISQDVLKAQMGFLASDWTEGREAGEKGEYIAGDYIASMLQLYEVKPGGDYTTSWGYNNNSKRTYFQNFNLLKTEQGDEHVMKVKSTDGITVKAISLTYNTDFFFRAADREVEIEAPVVFAGYGFRNERLKYDDFSNLNVKGKFILKISGVPEFARERLSSSELLASARDTENMLRKMGAAGILEFNPASTTVGYSPVPDFLNMSPSELTPSSRQPYEKYSLPGRIGYGNFVRISVSSNVAGEILEKSGIVIDDYIKTANSGILSKFPPITSKTIYLKTDVKSTPVRVRNVIGIIEGNDPEQIVVLGAHYDHEGMSNGYIWNGADDNASGTVGILTLAKAIMGTGKKPEKTIIITLWTAEEKGLLGSRYYVNNLTYPKEHLRLNLNFDMISRYISDDEPNKVTMTYTSSCPEFKELTANNLKEYGIDLDVIYEPSDDPPGGSDHRTFVEAGIPVMRFKPGHREEYHTPADEIETVDWDIMEKIVRISFTNIWELVNSSW